VREREARYGVPIYSPDDCRKLISAAAEHGGPMPAMILLALNGGCDAAWLSEVPIAAIDLAAGFVDWVRPKNEELCRFPLWPMTIEAIRQWIPRRPAPKDKAHADRLFITSRGNLFVREVVRYAEDGSVGDINPDDAIGKEFVKIEKAAGIAKRRGRRFKALRRTHATAANDITDRDARRMVMGHGFEGMDPHYVRGLFPAERLRKVTDRVGSKLLGWFGDNCPWPKPNKE
jgi:integrase